MARDATLLCHHLFIHILLVIYPSAAFMGWPSVMAKQVKSTYCLNSHALHVHPSVSPISVNRIMMLFTMWK